MPLSKERNRERMRQLRAVQPNLEVVQPNVYLAAHMKVYPQGFNPDGSYRESYSEKSDPFINPLLRPPEPLPNCPDGRYRVTT